MGLLIFIIVHNISNVSIYVSYRGICFTIRIVSWAKRIIAPRVENFRQSKDLRIALSGKDTSFSSDPWIGIVLHALACIGYSDHCVNDEVTDCSFGKLIATCRLVWNIWLTFSWLYNDFDILQTRKIPKPVLLWKLEICRLQILASRIKWHNNNLSTKLCFSCLLKSFEIK